MDYICTKPLNLGGKRYDIGEIIPEDAVVANRVLALISSGYMVEAGEVVETGTATMNNGIKIKMDDLEAVMTEEEVNAIFNIMIAKAEDAQKEIKAAENLAVPIIVSRIDSRKTVVAAAKERVKECTIELRAESPDPNPGEDA